MARILHLIDSLAPGGAQTVVRTIFEPQKENQSIFLYALRKRNPFIGICHNNVLGSASKSRFSPAPILGTIRLIRQHKINIIHCHLLRSQLTGWIVKILFFPNIVLVFHQHEDLSCQKKFLCLHKIIHRLFFYISSRKVATIIAVSKSVGDNFGWLGRNKGSKIMVLPNPLSPTPSCGNDRRAIRPTKKSTDGAVIGFAGRIVSSKGWRDFLSAAKIVHRQDKKTTFIIAGSGPEQKSLLQEIERGGLSAWLSYRGHVEKMIDFYSEIDCLVVPSYSEACPMVIIEAFANKVPVIAADIPGIAELISDRSTGFLFEKGSTQKLAKMIVSVIRDDKIRGFVAQNSYLKSKDFASTNYINQLNKLYENLQQQT